MVPTIEPLERALKKRFLCLSYLEKANDAPTAANQQIK